MSRYIVLAAIFMTGAALADIPPPPVDEPLDADCAPFTGVWAQQTPSLSRRNARTMVIAIGSERASIIVYDNQSNVFLEPRAIDGALACEATADGVTILKFEGPNEVKVELSAKLAGEATFTTTSEEPYLGAGPPVEGWTPKTITTTWVRLAK